MFVYTSCSCAMQHADIFHQSCSLLSVSVFQTQFRHVCSPSVAVLVLITVVLTLGLVAVTLALGHEGEPVALCKDASMIVSTISSPMCTMFEMAASLLDLLRPAAVRQLVVDVDCFVSSDSPVSSTCTTSTTTSTVDGVNQPGARCGTGS